MSNLKQINEVLDVKVSYELRGYSCKEDSPKLSQKLKISGQRAKVVKAELARIGFPQNQL